MGGSAWLPGRAQGGSHERHAQQHSGRRCARSSPSLPAPHRAGGFAGAVPFSVLGAQEQEVDGNLAPMAAASAARGGGVGCLAGDGCRWQLCWMTQEAAGGGSTSQGDGDGGVESRWEEMG